MNDRIQQLQAMLEKEPNDAFCLYGLAMEHAKRNQPAEAIAYFDRTIAVNPNECYAYFHKAKTQETIGDVTGARHTLQTGLERATQSGDFKAMSEIGAYLDALS